VSSNDLTPVDASSRRHYDTDGENHSGGPTMRAGGPASYSVLTPTMMSSAGRQSPAKIIAAEASLCRPIRDSRHDRLLLGFYIHGCDWDMNWVEQLPTPEGVVWLVRSVLPAELCPPLTRQVYGLLRYLSFDM
jgi:hypothetical protein